MVKIKLKKYINIPLPVELSKQIDNIIKHGKCGYKIKAEFVKEAVRERLRESIRLGLFKSKYK